MKWKLNKISSPWKRLYITIAVQWLALISRFASYRSRIHWVGYGYRRRRPERALIPALYLAGILILRGQDFALWSVYAGGVASIFLILHTAYRLIPVKAPGPHWIGRKR